MIHGYSMQLRWFVVVLCSISFFSPETLGVEPATPKSGSVVATETVAAAQCEADGESKLLVLRRYRFEPDGKPGDPGRAYICVVVLSAELHAIGDGKIDPNRERILWQNWHAFNPASDHVHDAFNFVVDRARGKVYLLWAHAFSSVGGMKVYEIDPRASLNQPDVHFRDGGFTGYDGVPERPKKLAGVQYSPITYIQDVGGAVVIGPSGNPSLMLFPRMGHKFDRFEAPDLRLDLVSKKLHYTDGREVKLDEENRPVNKPPAAGGSGAQGDK